MRIHFHKNFKKKYKKLTKKEQKRAQRRLALFLINPFNPVLNNHSLKGKFLDYRSINIAGDLRAIYKHLSIDECIFTELGRHSDLYS